jgi:hypothetical protein
LAKPNSGTFSNTPVLSPARAGDIDGAWRCEIDLPGIAPAEGWRPPRHATVNAGAPIRGGPASVTKNAASVRQFGRRRSEVGSGRRQALWRGLVLPVARSPRRRSAIAPALGAKALGVSFRLAGPAAFPARPRAVSLAQGRRMILKPRGGAKSSSLALRQRRGGVLPAMLSSG